VSTPITLRFDRDLVRSAVFTFWRRRLGVGFFVALAAMGGGVAYFVAQGERGWLVGAGGTVFVLAIIFVVAIFRSQYQSSLQRLHKMQPPEATLTLTESGFTLSSNLGSSTARWSAITELWEAPQFWLLFVSSAQYITLPTADIPRESLDEIRRSLVKAGGKVA
jgi:hypothetical protein